MRVPSGDSEKMQNRPPFGRKMKGKRAGRPRSGSGERQELGTGNEDAG